MNCTDCAHWNPDTPETDHCDVDTPAVKNFWAAFDKTYPMNQVAPDITHCPGFVQNPWNTGGLDLAQNGQLSHR